MLTPEIAINSWREWGNELHKRPVIVGSLSGGRSNHSFLLESDSKKVVLRLNSTNPVLPVANRNSEIEIWKAASQQGIAPPLLYTDENNRFLVSTYIDTSLPSQLPFNKALMKRAIDLLQRCHKLDVDIPGIDYSNHIEHYWQIIEAKDRLSNLALLEQRKSIQSILVSLCTSNSPTGPCHHDPVTANFVGNSGRLYLIDWEYAAQGLLVMDFAALAVEWGINDAKIRDHTGIEPELLVMAKALYGYLCALWQEATT